MSNSIICINNLDFSYLNKVVFSKFCLEIEEFSFVSLIGNNGSGKSTLLKIISGIIFDKGDIIIDSISMNCENMVNIRKKIGFINNDLENFFVSDDVITDLVFSLENLCYDKAQIDYELEKIIKLFKLDGIIDKKINELLDNEKVVLALACVLIYKPKILLLDEVFDKLNNKYKEEIFALLLDYKKKYNFTIIMVTHDMEDTLYGNRIVLVDNGKLCLNTTVYDFYSDMKRLKKYGVDIPFVVKMSSLLKDKGIVDDIYTNIDDLIGVL